MRAERFLLNFTNMYIDHVGAIETSKWKTNKPPFKNTSTTINHIGVTSVILFFVLVISDQKWDSRTSRIQKWDRVTVNVHVFPWPAAN